MTTSVENNNKTKDIKIGKEGENNLNKQFHQEKYKKKSDCPSFLLKLYQILENDEYKDIIHWDENGKNFIVQNLHDFTEKILPQYYKHNNYSSFIRQLNMYDFHKKKSSQNVHIFHHQNFIKDRKDLIKTIKRKSKKEKENISSSNNIQNNQKFFSKKTDLVPISNINIFNNINNNFNNNNLDNIINNDNNRKNSLSIDDDLNLSNSVNSLFESIKRPLLPMGSPSSNNNSNININNINNESYFKNRNDNCNNSNNINNNVNNINMNLLNGNDKKITKKNLQNLLTYLMHNIDDNTEMEKQLEIKIESLTKQNEEFIIQNQKLLQEIISKNEYNKKLEAVISFILEMIMTKPKIKNNSELKNLLLSNKSNNQINNLPQSTNNIDNLSLVNFTSPKHELNGILSKNDFIPNRGEVLEPFQNFLNKYLERTKSTGLFTNKENNYNNNLLYNFDYYSNNQNELRRNLIGDGKENNIQINPTLTSKKRKRSESFNTILSNLSDGSNVIYDNSYKNKNLLNENIKKEEEKQLDNENVKCNENLDNNSINNESFSSWNKSKNIFDIDLNQEESKSDENDWNKDLLNNTQSSFNELYSTSNINKDNEFCDINN